MHTSDAAPGPQSIRGRTLDRPPVDLGNGVELLVSRENCPPDKECYLHLMGFAFSACVLLDRGQANDLAERLTIPF